MFGKRWKKPNKLKHEWIGHMCTICKTERVILYKSVRRPPIYRYVYTFPSTGEKFLGENEPDCVFESEMRADRVQRVTEIKL